MIKKLLLGQLSQFWYVTLKVNNIKNFKMLKAMFPWQNVVISLDLYLL